MSLDATATTQQISDSIGAMLLLDASCQALIEASVAPSSSPWYAIVDGELGAAENLVVGWRQNGYRYFKAEILAQISACGATFAAARPGIDAQFKALEAAFDPATQAQLELELTALEAPVQGMVSALDGYNAKLAGFQSDLSGAYESLNRSVADIQAQEAQLQAQITSINAQIAQLQRQVQTDRAAIAQAEAQRTSGIIETIFGVVLAPFTGGLSLILAGIGVGTIAEAQEKVDALESTITTSQASIAQDQAGLSADEQQITTLSGLTMSVGLALHDMAAINTALTSLRTAWTVLEGQVTSAATSVAAAQTAPEALVAQVWFDAACDSWAQILTFVAGMTDLPQPTPKRVAIGAS